MHDDNVNRLVESAVKIQKIIKYQGYATVFTYYDGYKLLKVEQGFFSINRAVELDDNNKELSNIVKEATLLKEEGSTAIYGIDHLGLEMQNELINMLRTQGLSKIPKGQKIETIAITQSDKDKVEKTKSKATRCHRLLDEMLNNTVDKKEKTIRTFN